MNIDRPAYLRKPSGVVCAFLLLTMALETPTLAQSSEQASPAGQRLTAAIERRLQAAPGVPAFLIDVSARQGVVTLQGNVHDLLAKERAGALAATIRGVREVRNQIKVLPTHRKSWGIQRGINDALAAAPALRHDVISARVQNGFATLSGVVGSWPEKRLAGLLAERIWGVCGVDNKLRVAYGVRRSDAEIKSDILSRIKWDPWLRTPELDAEVTGGQVRFKGLVESAAARNRVAADGWVNGVKSVNISGVEIVPSVHLAMEQAGQERGAHLSTTNGPSDAELQTAIAEACHYDPLLMPANPKVQVEQGVVTLTGSVDSLEAKHAAGQIARDFSGVGHVENLLKVHPLRHYSDAEIRRLVEWALRSNSRLESEPINVVGITRSRGTSQPGERSSGA